MLENISLPRSPKTPQQQKKKFQKSGTKKEPKPKLLSPDIFRWGRGLPHEGVGAKKFGMSLETREIKRFWRDIRDSRDFAWISRWCPKSLIKKVCVQFLAPILRGLGIRPHRFSYLGSRKPPPRDLRAPERLSAAPDRLIRSLGDTVCTLTLQSLFFFVKKARNPRERQGFLFRPNL